MSDGPETGAPDEAEPATDAPETDPADEAEPAAETAGADEPETGPADEAETEVADASTGDAPEPRPTRLDLDLDTDELERTLEALLFLSNDPVTPTALADATGTDEDEVLQALAALAAHYVEDRRGIVLRELAGGWALASNPAAEDAARRLLSRPRTPALTPAQAETLAVVAYLQPVSRPEIARIRGVNAESAAATLIERGVIEEAGRSQFGAVLYRTTELFLRLFGLTAIEQLPDVTAWDPSPEVAANIRDRLLRAGEARLGTPAAARPAEGREGPSGAAAAGTADDDDADVDEADDEGPGAPVIPFAPPNG